MRVLTEIVRDEIAQLLARDEFFWLDLTGNLDGVLESVGEERAPQAMGWLEAVRYGGLTLGVLIGGVLTDALGSGAALLVDAGTFVLAAVAALSLRTRRWPGLDGDGEDADGMSAGMKLLAADPILRTTVLVLCAAVGFAAIVGVTLPPAHR